MRCYFLGGAISFALSAAGDYERITVTIVQSDRNVMSFRFSAANPPNMFVEATSSSTTHGKFSDGASNRKIDSV